MFDNNFPIYLEGDKKAGNDKCISIMLYNNKDSFIGKITNGQKTHGKMTYSNNETYEGEWLNDVRHGNGTMTYTDGRKPIIAKWINGYVAYQTKYTDKEGNKYDGSASKIDGEDIKNGMGTMIYKNGNEYRGLWQNDKFDSQGDFFDQSNRDQMTFRCSGTWSESGKRFEG